MASLPLVLGPMLRYTDETCAAIWVETDTGAEVSVHADDREWRSRTFAVHGHHYALVEIEDLAPGSVTPYEVRVNGLKVWPEADSSLPAPVIATRSPGRRLRMAWGSCRTSVNHDAAGNRTHGVDAMRTFALAMGEDAALATGPHSAAGRPGLRRHDDRGHAGVHPRPTRHQQPPGKELKDYEEYAHLYRLAWSDDANRWLLSTVPSAMIFDDHDVRDDWNASLDWKKQMEATSWWHGRIVAGLASYWVYQHLGNLSPAERAADEIWQRSSRTPVPGSRTSATPSMPSPTGSTGNPAPTVSATTATSATSVWSSSTPVVLAISPRRPVRSSTRPSGSGWTSSCRAGSDTCSWRPRFPFCCPSVCITSRRGTRRSRRVHGGGFAARIGERLRQMVDLEHWAAWQNSFQSLARILTEIADGGRGTAPETLLILSGDVHFSYIAEVERSGGGTDRAGGVLTGAQSAAEARCAGSRW